MKVSTAVALLLGLIGVANGFTDLINAGSNAARGAFQTGTNLGLGSLNAASGGARSLQGTFNPSSNFQRSRNSRNSFSNNPRSFNPSRQNVPSMPFFSNPTTQSPNFPEPDSATLPPPPNPVTVEAPSVQSFPQSPASVSNASSSANGRNENKGPFGSGSSFASAGGAAAGSSGAGTSVVANVDPLNALFQGARNAANAAASVGNTALASMGTAFSLQAITSYILNHPFVLQIINLINQVLTFFRPSSF